MKIVTGVGRSGSQWLAGVLGRFFDARHEPDTLGGDIVVDSRLRVHVPALRDAHELTHLVRDGRDVVRSAVGRHPEWTFEDACRVWADGVDMCEGLPTVQLKDLLRAVDRTPRYALPHWREWTDEQAATFWAICGDQMRRHGYER